MSLTSPYNVLSNLKISLLKITILGPTSPPQYPYCSKRWQTREVHHAPLHDTRIAPRYTPHTVYSNKQHRIPSQNKTRITYCSPCEARHVQHVNPQTHYIQHEPKIRKYNHCYAPHTTRSYIEHFNTKTSNASLPKRRNTPQRNNLPTKYRRSTKRPTNWRRTIVVSWNTRKRVLPNGLNWRPKNKS